ncbi:2-oxo-4-hydroxy-4-carboxy-5-ureidoimidazoline decarboxylase [Neobacillus cucumis]|uniref:2-oxo-4-hydroxy-4-carboxy-5-ureidoimidazoline decarboxylase n=1 Tax=Neobacillus cucumis TaxID=1740721 RepID=UPI001963B10E|nr:2-oxo-4-hydroxy-4-carboxy-5-ureidoimidazoline decarboxylase [Neobacillus cucumis]MBM7655386.1 2-oxo-4-hydroxy-4-carboxy-5-ureidoimidazoline decarboxylase [Neobacillus cucumis]
MYTISEINHTTSQQFLEIAGGIFEQSPWIANKAAELKPFISLYHLHQEMVKIVENSTYEQKFALIQAHPNLGERAAMTTESTQEQQGAGLQNLAPEEYEEIISLNQEYMKKFDFPFILAVRGKTKLQIFEAMKERIHHSIEHEFNTALSEIYQIALLRLKEKITDIPKM